MNNEKSSFRDQEQELEAVLNKVEDGSYEDINELLEDYKRGKKLIEKLEKRLETAKNTITKSVSK